MRDEFGRETARIDAYAPIPGLRGAFGAFVAEQATDLERRVALQRLDRHAVVAKIDSQLLGARHLRAAAVRRREDVDPRRIGIAGPPPVRALDDGAPEQHLAQRRPEHSPAEAVTEAC